MMDTLKFATTKSAIQYLSDFTGTRVFIAKKVNRILAQKVLQDEYSDDLFIKVIESDPTVKETVKVIDDQTNINGSYLLNILNWIKDKIIKERDLDDTKKTLKEFHEFKQKNVKEIAKDGSSLIKKNPKYIQSVLDDIKRKRPRPEDSFSHLDDQEIGRHGVYRAFYIENSDEAEDSIRESLWCVKDEEYFCQYDPPFYFFTKGNKFYALLNKTGVLEMERIPFDEWLDMNDYVYDEQATITLKDNYEASDYDIMEQAREYHEEYENDWYNENPDSEEEPLSFEKWLEKFPEREDDAKQILEEQYEPTEDEIQEHMEEEIYPHDESENTYRGMSGTGSGMEFNNAENSTIKAQEVKPISPLLDDLFAEKDPDFLVYLYDVKNMDEEKANILDEVKRKIKRNLPVDPKKLREHPEFDKLKELFPGYFMDLAEKHGQTKMFSSSSEAIQYLADLLSVRVTILK